MSKALFVPLQLSLGTVICLSTNPLLAQVTTDGTVNTQVNQNGNVAEITGGETRGGNLFHSFQDFSVPVNNEAFFNNANSIDNIFSRVTGGNISNIDGAIRANGSANLFLINPAGIVFGEGARLDIGGSFYGSTASSILFEDGEFSAADLENPPLLTVNAPIGLNFRDEPGDIVNRSVVQNNNGILKGLEVSSGNNLALVGGNLNFEGGSLIAMGGNIELGSLLEAGVVNLNEDGSFNFPENIARGSITLSNGSRVDVGGFGEGNININAGNLNLIDGERGDSSIRAGVRQGSLVNAQAGDININVTENILLDDGRISNNQGGFGNAGDIFITTGSLSIENGGFVESRVFGRGDGGSLNITATGDINLIGRDIVTFFPSRIENTTNSDAVGDTGIINVLAKNINLDNGGEISQVIFGSGNAGIINLTATGDINIINTDGNCCTGQIISIGSLGRQDEPENVGSINISANNLNLTDGGEVVMIPSIFVEPGDINFGEPGDININVKESILISGAEFSRTGITSYSFFGNGRSGSINISTQQLTIANNGIVGASNFDPFGMFFSGDGTPGNISIQATNLDLFSNSSINSESQSIEESANSTIRLNVAEDITLNGNSFISAQSFNDANGGNLDINARFIIAFPSNEAGNDLIATADRGIGGNINLEVEQIFGLAEGRAIDSSNIFPSSNGTNDIDIRGNVEGNLNINTDNINPLQGATELPVNIVELTETTQQACQANREAAAQNGLNIAGKGGVPPAPDLPLNSLNTISDGAINPVSTIPAPIETAQGKIQLARGVEVTESGEIRLVPYRTNNAGDRIPEIKPNCGKV